MSHAALPHPTVNPEINPLLFQTLGKWYAANVNELAALTNVFSLLKFTDVEDRKDMLSWKDLCFPDTSAFLIECPLNVKSCEISLPTNSQFLCINKCDQLLFLLETQQRKISSVQTCPPPISQSRAESSITWNATNRPPLPNLLYFLQIASVYYHLFDGNFTSVNT